MLCQRVCMYVYYYRHTHDTKPPTTIMTLHVYILYNCSLCLTCTTVPPTEHPQQSRRESRDSRQQQSIQFGHNRMTHKFDKKVEVNFLANRKTSLPVESGARVVLPGKRRQTIAGTLGVKNSDQRTVTLQSLAIKHDIV